MRYLTICGTRPEIIKLCDWEDEIIFTGQHFSYDMGEKFLLNKKSTRVHFLPTDIDHSNIGVLTQQLEEKLVLLGSDIIIVHGDTRSTLAGARAAHKLKMCLAHIESGVRCFRDTVEETYRKEIDQLANYNFCPVPNAVEHLKKEGITEGVYFTGDILYDRFLENRECWDFVFVTIHRQENIENKDKLKQLIDSLKDYGYIIFPLHPHTRECLEKFKIDLPRNVVEMPPLGYEETLRYIKDAKLILTDSGGIQREAYWSGTPCKVARESTEWGYYTGAFGNGKAGDKIKEILDNRKPYRKVEGGYA